MAQLDLVSKEELVETERNFQVRLDSMMEVVSELQDCIANEWITSKQAQKDSGRTRQAFYQLVYKYDIKSTGQAKAIRYKRSDVQMAIRLEGKANRRAI